MVDYIDAHEDEFGVEPICEELPIAPSTYYARRRAEPSARALKDEAALSEIRRVHSENLGFTGCGRFTRSYGVRGTRSLAAQWRG